jgi:hypothetical protein
MIRSHFNKNKEVWFRNEAQLEDVRRIIHDRLADDTYQNECRYLMRFWYHLTMPYQEVSYNELKKNVSKHKMDILEELFDAIDSSFEYIDSWIYKYESELPSLEERPRSNLS